MAAIHAGMIVGLRSAFQPWPQANVHGHWMSAQSELEVSLWAATIVEPDQEEFFCQNLHSDFHSGSVFHLCKSVAKNSSSASF
jgi:hypothetical protein